MLVKLPFSVCHPNLISFSIFSESPLHTLRGKHHIHCDGLLYDSKLLFYNGILFPKSTTFCLFWLQVRTHASDFTELSEISLSTHSHLLGMCDTMNMQRLTISGQAVSAFFVLQHNFFLISHPLQSTNLCHRPIRISSQKENHWFTREHKHRLSRG